MKRVLAVSALALLLALTFAGTSSAARSPAATRQPLARTFHLPRIVGVVGGFMSFSVSPRSVPTGRYRIVVHDSTPGHSWHITGPSIDRATSISGTGTSTWFKRLTPGTYHIFCDVHPKMMHTTLKVTPR